MAAFSGNVSIPVSNRGRAALLGGGKKWMGLTPKPILSAYQPTQSPRGKNRDRKNLKKLFTRFSRARQESFFLELFSLDKGLSRELSFCGVNQDLGAPRRRVAQGCDIKLSHSFTPALWHYTLESMPLSKARCVLCDPRS
jgi:hypothetical protein